MIPVTLGLTKESPWLTNGTGRRGGGRTRRVSLPREGGGLGGPAGSVADVRWGFTKLEGDGRTLTRLKRQHPVQLCREEVDESQA
jgi:hypothetical protein